LENYPSVVTKSGLGSPQWNYLFQFASSTGKINLYSETVNPSWVNYANTAVPLNTWTHIAVTYNGTYIQYYFNGNPDGSYVKTGTFSSSSNTLSIGKRYDGFLFNGSISDVRIYDRALDEDEIRTLYLGTE